MMSSGKSQALEDWDQTTFTWALKDMQIVAGITDGAGLRHAHHRRGQGTGQGSQAHQEGQSAPLDRCLAARQAGTVGGEVLAFTSWRGIVGMIAPTMRPGMTEEVIRLLPEGIGVIPLFLDINRGTEDEFETVMAAYEEKVAILAGQGCDIIHPIGAPPFMIKGLEGERQLVSGWQEKYGVPDFHRAAEPRHRPQCHGHQVIRRGNLFPRKAQSPLCPIPDRCRL